MYCPYHSKNRDIKRKKLTQDQIREEVIALEAMGHKRMLLSLVKIHSIILLNIFWNPLKLFTVLRTKMVKYAVLM